MSQSKSVLDAISAWFYSECDGDWEHENQIKIETVSNPGWSVRIDLTNTSMENIHFEKSFNNSDDDWCFMWVKDMTFNATGDINKLAFILSEFLSLTNSNVRE